MNQVRAIVWAQWRSSWNRLPGINRGSAAISVLIGLFWYGGFVALAIGAGSLMAMVGHHPSFLVALGPVLLLMMLFWQITPVMTASTGSALELRKLQVYPIPRDALFALEVLLRVTTGVEVILILVGAAIGALLNRRLPLWSFLGFVLFIVFNLLLAVGIRDLLVRLFAKKRVREIAMFLLVSLAALPRLLIFAGAGWRVRAAIAGLPTAFLPWDAAAAIATGRPQWWTPLVLLCWIGAAWVFAQTQFQRSINVEVEQIASSSSGGQAGSRLEFLCTWPARVFADPLAALMEKEIRALGRSSRFRVIFAIGFTLGLVVWIPISLEYKGQGQAGSFAATNFLTIVCAYAVMLLTDLLFFNCLGPDRGGAQIYFLVPVPLGTVLVAKNAVAAFFVLAELALITVACLAFRLPVTPARIAETFSVCLVMTVLLLAVGNMASVWNPRPTNPAQPFRNQTSRVQWMALVAFPLASIPAVLAYLARFAFDSEVAFFGVLLVFGAAGAYVYWLALEVAVRHGELDREHIIEELSRHAGVVADS
jgi:ABC-2 type transport system permease protein